MPFATLIAVAGAAIAPMPCAQQPLAPTAPPSSTGPAPVCDDTFCIEARGPDVAVLRNVGAAKRAGNATVLIRSGERVYVFDAPRDAAASARVIDIGRLRFPDAPFSLIVSHGHGDDDVGGLGPFLDQGVDILGPVGTARRIRRIATAHGLSQPARTVALTTEVRSVRDIGGSATPIRLFNLRSKHARRMLVAHLPVQRLLVQADPTRAGDDPRHAPGSALPSWIRRKRLDVAEVVDVNGEAAPR